MLTHHCNVHNRMRRHTRARSHTQTHVCMICQSISTVLPRHNNISADILLLKCSDNIYTCLYNKPHKRANKYSKNLSHLSL